MHHPFTAPQDDQWDLLETDPGAVIAKAYDLAANGSELAGGSIRIHQRAQQERVFAALGYPQAEVDELFGHLLEAFEYGAPPHGGFAGGIDRLVVTFSDTAESIRDAIAFPKTQAGVDPLFGAPSPVASAQLHDLHIAVVAVDEPEA
jgi:aspartyl-tRNA synthetase